MERYLLYIILSFFSGFMLSHVKFIRTLPLLVSAVWILFRFLVPYQSQTALIHAIHIAILDFVFVSLMLGNVIGFIKYKRRTLI